MHFWVAAVMIAFYQMMALNYASHIFVHLRRSAALTVFICVLNTFVLLYGHQFNLPYPAIYLLSELFLLGEFWVLSYGDWRQAFFGASMFVFNITSIHLLCAGVLTSLLQLAPADIMPNQKAAFYISALTFFVSWLVLLSFTQMIPNKDVILVSTDKFYSPLLALLCCFITVYTCVDAYLLFGAASLFPNLLLTIISTTMLSFVMFYIAFLYSVHNVKMSKYKRKSDQLKTARKENEAYKNKLQALKVRDPLTLCYNREYIMDRLNRMVEGNEAPFGLLFMDVNGLKYVNDHFGHIAGDQYLCRLSEVLQESLRDEDILARIGGDEFIVILQGLSEKDVQAVIGRITENVKRLKDANAIWRPSLSIGSVWVNETLMREGALKIIQTADEAMREKKQQYYEKKEQV